jgi:hypothetical protein
MDSVAPPISGKALTFCADEDPEERLDKYIAAIKGLGSLPDQLRLIARSHNHARLRTNIMQAIQKDEVIGELFPAAISMDKVENQYSINMAIEVERLTTIPIFGQYALEAIDTILGTENKTSNQ